MVYTNYIIACDNLNICRPMYPDTNTNTYSDYDNITTDLYNSLYYVPLALFYTMVGYGYASLYNYIKKSENEYIYQYKDLSELKLLENQNTLEKIVNTNTNTNTNKYEDIKYEDEANEVNEINEVNETNENTDSEDESNEENELDDSDEILKKQEIVSNMLSTKTVERALVLYYIFIFKGNYTVKRKEIVKNGLGEDIEEEIIEEYNSFKEFNNMDSIIENQNTDYDTYNLFNLDETLLPDTKIKIGEKEYNINQAHLNFISWLYSSGIYEYLTTNDDIKFNILDEMNEQKLLRGNVFLRYQLQLCSF